MGQLTKNKKNIKYSNYTSPLAMLFTSVIK